MLYVSLKHLQGGLCSTFGHHDPLKHMGKVQREVTAKCYSYSRLHSDDRNIGYQYSLGVKTT